MTCRCARGETARVQRTPVAQATTSPCCLCRPTRACTAAETRRAPRAECECCSPRADRGPSSLINQGQNGCTSFRYAYVARVEGHVSSVGCLVRIVDSRHVLKLAPARARVQAFRVASLALVERRAHVHFDEPRAQSANELSAVAVRRDKRRDDGYAVGLELAREIAHAANVRVALGASEA